MPQEHIEAYKAIDDLLAAVAKEKVPFSFKLEEGKNISIFSIHPSRAVTLGLSKNVIEGRPWDVHSKIGQEVSLRLHLHPQPS